MLRPLEVDPDLLMDFCFISYVKMGMREEIIQRAGSGMEYEFEGLPGGQV